MLDDAEFWRRYNTPVRRASEMTAEERERIMDGT